MLDMPFEIVRFALALHLGVTPEAIAAEHRLDDDLGLDPLDLVLVVLRLEELEEAEFPVAELEHVRSVNDLVAVVRGWAPPPMDRVMPDRRASGTHPVAPIVPLRIAVGS